MTILIRFFKKSPLTYSQFTFEARNVCGVIICNIFSLKGVALIPPEFSGRGFVVKDSALDLCGVP